MRKLLILVVFMGVSFNMIAQKDTVHKRGVEPGSVSIGVGVGASTIFYAANGVSPYEIAQPIFILPAITAFADYNCTRRSSIGAAITYQYIYQNPIGDNDEVDYYNTQFIQRFNISFRYLLHFSRNPDNDFYLGVRPGLSIWITNNMSTASGSNGYNTVVPGITTNTDPSIQFLLGYKAYNSNHLGIHFEAGIGTPYFIEGGVSYRILPAKKK